MHKVVSLIKNLLDEKKVWYEYMEHESGITSEEMVEKRGNKYSLSEGSKSLILEVDDGFIQVVVTGDQKFSNSKLRKILKTKNIRFVSEDKLKEITDGILPGAVPPFGNLFNLQVFVDNKVSENEKIVFNCGERTASIAMLYKDYEEIVKPNVVDIT